MFLHTSSGVQTWVLLFARQTGYQLSFVSETRSHCDWPGTHFADQACLGLTEIYMLLPPVPRSVSSTQECLQYQYLNTSQPEAGRAHKLEVVCSMQQFSNESGLYIKTLSYLKMEKKRKNYWPLIRRISFSWFVWCTCGLITCFLSSLKAANVNSESLSDKYQPGFLLFPFGFCFRQGFIL